MGGFTSFVVFAEMRTGSNFFETNLNAIPGITCHGEAFNPHFIGYPDRKEILGITEARRQADPQALLAAIRTQSGGLGGFRYFNDHDPRVFDPVMDDRACAKIVLTRNPLESYVSWKIAQETGQWKLTHHKGRKRALATFDATEFEAHVTRLQAFQIRLMSRLQVSGQTAFYVDYEDLQRVEVMNGLAAWLGVPGRIEALDPTLKRQNPGTLRDKLDNPDEAEAALARLDRFHLSRTPSFEPRRGAGVPGFVAGAQAPLLFLPVAGGPDGAIRDWLAAVDGVGADDLLTGMNQKALRQWKRRHPGHRSFAVLRHPLARAHHVFCTRILATGKGAMGQVRATLRRLHNLPIPEDAPGPDWTPDAHRAAFSAWLDWVKLNLSGGDSIRNAPAWESQANALQGMAEALLPDAILREDELATALPALARAAGLGDVPAPSAPAPDVPHSLASIHDAYLEEQARDVYQRDYMMFGFTNWKR